VDGGISTATAPLAVGAGATVLVAGSAVYGGAGTVADNLRALRLAASGGADAGSVA
jgi:ribulose-phosphate 3-epimerase